MNTTIILSVVTIVIVTLILVALLLWIKNRLSPKGSVTININDGNKILKAAPGMSLMSTLAANDIFLPSACGGKANCGQCKVRVFEGGGAILPTETGYFNRKQIKDNFRLGCQVKVKENLKIAVPDSILSVKKLECEVISNHNVATFIKEFTVRLPENEHLDFKSGEYIQIDIPECSVDFNDIDVDPEYKPDWERYNFFKLKMVNPEATMRAYSMASYPAEGNIIKLNVRIATPPFDRTAPRGSNKLLPVNPGIASSYVFSRHIGDKVMISGPFGEFLLPKDDPDSQEYIFVGGGAGMAPLRSHIMHLFKTLKTKKTVNFFYGARSLKEAFYLEDYSEIENEFPNFHFHLALDRPDPAADAAGVKYVAGFVHNVMFETYLKNHDNPEDIKYFMCGPPMMVKSVNDLLDSLGVPEESILYDNFGG
ncbi:MAG: NADH:ubiquinone reductase (Na(+)-transporting) subunit F [Bacteroidales bacterium]|nr:NADH:ubiquinone reductase (Na(+)-transporting) subunit F [Bacteroidales bacterium]